MTGLVSRTASVNISTMRGTAGKRGLTSTGLRNVTFTFIGPAVMTCIVRVGVSTVVTKLLSLMPTLLGRLLLPQSV